MPIYSDLEEIKDTIQKIGNEKNILKQENLLFQKKLILQILLKVMMKF